MDVAIAELSCWHCSCRCKLIDTVSAHRLLKFDPVILHLGLCKQRVATCGHCTSKAYSNWHCSCRCKLTHTVSPHRAVSSSRLLTLCLGLCKGQAPQKNSEHYLQPGPLYATTEPEPVYNLGLCKGQAPNTSEHHLQPGPIYAMNLGLLTTWACARASSQEPKNLRTVFPTWAHVCNN